LGSAAEPIFLSGHGRKKGFGYRAEGYLTPCANNVTLRQLFWQALKMGPRLEPLTRIPAGSASKLARRRTGVRPSKS